MAANNTFKITSPFSISRYISENNMKNKSLLIFGNTSGLFGYYLKKDGIIYPDVNSDSVLYNGHWLIQCIKNNVKITIVCDMETYLYYNRMLLYFSTIQKLNINNIKIITFCGLSNIDSNKNKDNEAKSIISDIINMGKFDVCIMNAPYDGKLHEKFESAAIDMVNDEIVFVGPLAWAIGKDRTKNKTILNQCNAYHTEIDTINPSEYFDANISGVMGITYINKKSNDTNTIYNGVKQENIYEMCNVSDDTVIYKYYKIFNIVDNNIQNYIAKTSENVYFSGIPISVPDNNNYIIRILRFSGHSTVRSKKIGEFYGIFSKSMKKDERCNTYQNILNYNNTSDIAYILCPTKIYATNLWNYLHTDFSMFIMYMYKTTLDISNGELKHLPALDFNEEWDDLKLFKYFGFSKQEVEHIYNVIPNYYNNDRKYVLDNYEK